MSDVILCNISDANRVIKERRKEWVEAVLISLGFEDLDPNNVHELRGALSQKGFYVESKAAGEEIDIYKREWFGDEENGSWLPPTKKHLIAQWKQPKFIRKIEGREVYYELHLNEWSFTNTRK